MTSVLPRRRVDGARGEIDTQRALKLSAWILGSLTLAIVGCGDEHNAGRITYATSEKVSRDLAGKPKLQDAVNRLVAELYGPDPGVMRVPPGSPLRLGGRLLASKVVDRSNLPEEAPDPPARPILSKNSEPAAPRQQLGGYALYRKNCLHCHGVSGDGKGPTADFLWPRPRDYRPGIFKFTSTTGEKPTRDDLRRTIQEGLHGTSMPAFEALMTPLEIEQVLDYVIFLSLRGQAEQRIAEEAAFDETMFDDHAAARDLAFQVSESINTQWKGIYAGGELEVVSPQSARQEGDRQSILRGRELYLGRTPEKLQCAGCHGAGGRGDGSSFVAPEVFNAVVFRGRPISEFDDATRKLWTEGSLDAWGQPLRPANINNGERTSYKGGRRPIDLYWRIAKGVGGAKMPAHLTLLNSQQIWDLVNFVLALPYEPGLLPQAEQLPSVPAVANR